MRIKHNNNSKISFNVDDLSDEDKVLLQHEKRLQYLLYNGEYKDMMLQHITCDRMWKKYLNTSLMKEGHKISDKSYKLCLENLNRIKGNVG